MVYGVPKHAHVVKLPFVRVATPGQYIELYVTWSSYPIPMAAVLFLTCPTTTSLLLIGFCLVMDWPQSLQAK